MSTSSRCPLDESARVQNSNTLGEVMRSEQAATANAIANMVTDIVNMGQMSKGSSRRWTLLKKKLEQRRRSLRKRTQEWKKVEEAIQEHAKKIQQMEEEIAKMNAGEATERITKRRKAMESDLGGKYKGRWSPSFITLNGRMGGLGQEDGNNDGQC